MVGDPYQSGETIRSNKTNNLEKNTMEQSRRAERLTRAIREALGARALGASGRSRERRLLAEAADMIDVLAAGSALAEPDEDGAVLGSAKTSREAALMVFPKPRTKRSSQRSV